MNKEAIESNKDLVIGTTNYDPEGRLLYDPVVGKLALCYGLAGAVVMATFAYLIASGVMPIRDFGQFSTSGSGVATFVGFVTGLATGGFIGSMVGLHHTMQKSAQGQSSENMKS